MLLTVALAVAVQLLASVTVTVYVPAPTPLKSSVVAPLLHKYVYGLVPPVTVRFTDPLLLPHVASVATAPALGPPIFITVSLPVHVQQKT